MTAIHNDLPGMTEALAARRRIDDGLTWLRNHSRPREIERGRVKLVKIAARDYLPALARIAETDRRDLLRHRSDTKRRLSRGMDRTGERADERWVQLLAEFEVITDALMLGQARHPRQPLVQLLGRIEAIEAAIRPEHSDSPARVEAVA